jgi:hypothetical protein
MFALGTFIAVVSLVRLIIFLNIPISTQGDATYNFREIIVWSIVEINIGLKPALSMIGVTKLFSFNTSRPSGARTPGPYPSNPSHGGLDSKSSRPRKKGATGGLFSTLAGISRMEEEDDEFKMVPDDSGRGKHNVEIELNRVSNDSGQRHPSEGLNGISVQKNWSVFAEERRK